AAAEVAAATSSTSPLHGCPRAGALPLQRCETRSGSLNAGELFCRDGVEMKDVQSSRDHRDIAIDKVGVSGLRYPIIVLDRTAERQQTTARIKVSVNLPKEFKRSEEHT